MESESFNLRLIYWFMFIYYSLQAMDEMIELFSVTMQLEKGALGLFFELNYLVGMFNTGHCLYYWQAYILSAGESQNKFDIIKNSKNWGTQAQVDTFREHDTSLENFILFQAFYTFFGFVVILAVWFMFKRVESKAKAAVKTGESDDKFQKSIN
jgi:hypothetical protein